MVKTENGIFYEKVGKQMPKALQVQLVDQAVITRLVDLAPRPLLPGQVRIAVAYSSINFKDYLACQYQGGVIRHYPMVPGIDASGVVIETADPHFHVGDQVLISGYEFGVSEPGGYQTEVVIEARRVLALPDGLTLRTAMVIGTAGLAAWLAVDAISNQGVLDHQAPLLVTGASGGVGSLALAFLSALGYQDNTALTRQTKLDEQLTNLGATELIDANQWQALPAKPLLPGRYQALIDTIGGKLTGQALAQLKPRGLAALVGNAASNELPTTVLPFILRGISVAGIDVVNLPMAERGAAWTAIGQIWGQVNYPYVQEVALADLSAMLARFNKQTHFGRFLVKVNDI